MKPGPKAHEEGDDPAEPPCRRRRKDDPSASTDGDDPLEFELDPESEEYRELCEALAAELSGVPLLSVDDMADIVDEFDAAVEEDLSENEL